MGNSSDFGQQFKAHRVRAGLTQRELADRMDLHFTYISKIESARVPPPSREQIERAAEILALSPDERDRLLLLADKVPADLEDWIVENPGAVKLYRAIKKVPPRVQESLLEYLTERAEGHEISDGPDTGV